MSARPMPRRNILKTLAATPFAGASLAALLADPSLARAAADGLETISIDVPRVGPVTAALAMPAQSPAPAIMLIHEWWGLNDQIKSVAADLARQGYIALAIDLYGGKSTADRSEARALMSGVNQRAAVETTRSWLKWLKSHEACNGRLGTIGWCFGGGWSVNASVAYPVDATVVYYGRVNQEVTRLIKLNGPVLGHFATRDGFIDQDMVAGFEKRMDRISKSYTNYWYEADHAFANPTSARYDEGDAALAWSRTLEFFAAHLRG